MNRRGVTLIEILVAVFLFAILGTWIINDVLTMYYAQQDVSTIPAVRSDVIDCVTSIANEVKKASLRSGSIVSGEVANSAVKAGGANSLKIYTSTSGSTALYDVETVSGVTGVYRNGNRLLLSGTSTLTFSYCLTAASGSTSFNSYSSVDPDSSSYWTSSIAQGSTDLAGICLIKITVSATRSGITSSYSTTVRLRNSPKASTT